LSNPPPQPEGLRAPGSGPGDPERVTRKRLSPWDRIKFLLGLSIAYLVLVWNHLVTFEGITTFPESLVATASDRWGMVIFTLIGLEVLRQIHFLISERSAGYHHFWTKKVFGGFERWSHRRFSDWTRFRIARVIKVFFWIAVIAMVLAAVLDTNPLTALFTAPALLWQVLPYGLQLAFAFFFIIFQFVGLFWFLSRGGIDTYYPDDIKTRFSDVWGQDHVVEPSQSEHLAAHYGGEVDHRWLERSYHVATQDFDRDVINEVVGAGTYTPAFQAFPPASFAFNEEIGAQKRDVERAKQLIKEAGYDRVPVEISYGNNTIMQQVFELVQAMGAEAGFDITLRPTEFAALQSALKAGDFYVGQSGWSGRVDPDGNIHQYVSCEGGLNDMKYCNEEVDRLLNAARATSDEAERKKLYDQAQVILQEDIPVIYLFYLPWPFAHKATLEGFVPVPDGMIRLENVKFAG